MFAASVLFGDTDPGAVVEDVAVLQDLDEGRAFVSGGLFEGIFQVSLEDVDRARNESSFSADCEGDGIEGAVERAVGGGLCFLVEFGGRRILTFCQAIDTVVKEKHLKSDVPTKHVNGVITTDREGVAVAGGHPDLEIGTNGFDAGGYGRRPAVDGVEAESVHVVREAGRASDAGDDDKVFALNAELGKNRLD